MAKIMLHDEAAREALGRGVAKLAKAVRGTLGPKGMNAIIDRPVGTPLVSRDGVSIAREIELEDPFENMGAQVVREVSMQTNEVAGDGTTTATVLADALVQGGLQCLANGANPVELVRGLELAIAHMLPALQASARPPQGAQARAVAVIAANDQATGDLVAEALERVGLSGVVTVEIGDTVETRLEVIDGMGFDRGYLSHHMVNDVEAMQAVLDNPLILMTDLKLQTAEQVATLRALLGDTDRPLLIIADEVAPACVVALLATRENGGAPVAAIHPPDYGHWRKSMLEDLAIVTGGRVIARDLGGQLDQVALRDLGSARQVRISAQQTVIITGGGGDPVTLAARREQVARQLAVAPPNIEHDKLQERLARLAGGTAVIRVGGATPVEQKRRAQLIEDSIHAVRAATEEGVVAGGGTALLQLAPSLSAVIDNLSGSVRDGAALVQRALAQPLACIAGNCGLDADDVVAHVASAPAGYGLDARTGRFVDMLESGIIDPVKVSTAALRNAASVAALILTTQTLIASKSDNFDPTAGAALGGGAERLGRA